MKSKLKLIDQQLMELLARRPRDRRESNRVYPEFLKAYGISPNVIGLDDAGNEVPGFNDPEDPPASIPCHRQTLRLFRYLRGVQELLAIADNPAKMAEMPPEAQEAMSNMNLPPRRQWQQVCEDVFHPDQALLRWKKADAGKGAPP
jgi:hypothetical protein